MWKKIAQDHQPLIVELRRQLHLIPELGNQEYKTTAMIHHFLEQHHIPHRLLQGTGALADIPGQQPGSVWAIRTDIDALPIQEDTGLPFTSTHPGIMHACGHDAHTAVALTLAKILTEHQDMIPGHVKIIFQPNEEGTPTGSPLVIAQGVMENPVVDYILGFHIDTSLDKGRIGIKKGLITSYVYNFDVKIIGKGAHAARPQEGIDPVPVMAEMIMALQTISSRYNDPNHPFVLTVGKVSSGTARNIIPEQAEFNGTIRMANTIRQDDIRNHFYQIIRGLSSAYGVQSEITFIESCPAVINDDGLADQLAAHSINLFSESNLTTLTQPSLGGDDFAFYLKNCHGLFFRLGVRDPEIQAIFPGHHPQFRLSEEGLFHALALYLQMIFTPKSSF